MRLELRAPMFWLLSLTTSAAAQAPGRLTADDPVWKLSPLEADSAAVRAGGQVCRRVGGALQPGRLVLWGSVRGMRDCHCFSGTVEQAPSVRVMWTPPTRRARASDWVCGIGSFGGPPGGRPGRANEPA
jgi:hypothetical protein